MATTEAAAIFASKGEMRKLVQGGGVSINKEKLAAFDQVITVADLLNDKYILILEIMSYSADNLPDKILIQVVDSKDQSKILRQGQGKGLYEAFNLGVIWLDHECRKD